MESPDPRHQQQRLQKVLHQLFFSFYLTKVRQLRQPLELRSHSPTTPPMVPAAAAHRGLSLVASCRVPPPLHMPNPSRCGAANRLTQQLAWQVEEPSWWLPLKRARSSVQQLVCATLRCAAECTTLQREAGDIIRQNAFSLLRSGASTPEVLAHPMTTAIRTDSVAVSRLRLPSALQWQRVQ